MSTAPPEIDEIRRKMAQIRRDLHKDVRGVVQGAEAATDWRRFIRNYPWASMGVAVFAGYLIVPRRHRPSTTIQIAPAEATPARAVETFRAPEPEKKKGKGLVGMLFGMVAPIAFKAAQGYALQYAEQWLAQRVAQQAQLHPDLAAILTGQQPPQGPPSQGPGPGPAPRGPQVGPQGVPRF